MAKKVISAGSTSANYHVHIRREPRVVGTASAGLANESSFWIPLLVHDARITVAGAFGSVSGSGGIAIDIGPDASTFFNLFSVSAPFMTTIPIQAGHIVRFRQVLGSANGASVDAWIG